MLTTLEPVLPRTYKINIVSTPVQTSSIPRLSLKKRFITLKLYAAKIMQSESNSKAGKRSFTRLDTAEPKLILCKNIKDRHIAVAI